MPSRPFAARPRRRARAADVPTIRTLARPAAGSRAAAARRRVGLVLAAALLAGLALPVLPAAEAETAHAAIAAPAVPATPSPDASATPSPAPTPAPTASPADAGQSATQPPAASQPAATPAPTATPTPSETPSSSPMSAPAQAFAAPAGSGGLLPAAPYDPSTISCWGDSLSYHICDPAYGQSGQSHLQRSFGYGPTVVNHAIGSQTSTEIATRMGAYTLTASFPGNVIPGSGSVRITVGNVPGAFKIFYPWVQIGGVVGKLERSRSLVGEWTFTRSQAGPAVAVAPGTPIQMMESADRGQASIIWVGRNNVDSPEQVIQDVARMVALHTEASSAPYWVVSVTPASYETPGTSGAANIARINAALASTYGAHYVPLDDYLRERGMQDRGLAMTAADRAAADRGTLPPSILDADGLHFNTNGRIIIADYLASIVRHPDDVSLRNFDPQGDFSTVLDANGVMQVVGWGFDKADLGAALPIRVTVDGHAFADATADRPSEYLYRFGVPGQHAFWTAGRLSPGAHEVCVTVGNLRAGADLRLPCRTVQVASSAPRLDPQGAFTVIADDIAGTITVVGWAFDHSNLYAQIPVEVSIDGRGQGRLTASMPTDYLRQYGVPGGHGFVGGYAPGAGSHRVCVTAIDQAPGISTNLGCQEVRLNPVNWNPEGHAAISMGSDGRISVSGYAFDRSALAAPLQIAVFQNGALTTMFTGNAAQPSLAPYGIPGPHGIAQTVSPLEHAGPSSFCVLAVNQGRGESTWLGCWDIDTRALSPQAAISAEPNQGGGIRVDGWAYDASVPLNPVGYTVAVDGRWAYAGRADGPRRELATFFGWPGDHGFSIDLPSPGPGAHTVCVTFWNEGRSAAETTRCTTVTT